MNNPKVNSVDKVKQITLRKMLRDSLKRSFHWCKFEISNSITVTTFVFLLIYIVASSMNLPAAAKLSQNAQNFSIRGLMDGAYNSGKFNPMTKGGERGTAPFPHPDLYAAQSAVSPAQMENNTPQLMGSHAPQMSSQNTNPRQIDPSKFPKGNKMEYADGGSKQGGPCCGDPGCTSGFTTEYFEKNCELDGSKDQGRPLTDKYRELPYKKKTTELNSPAAYDHGRQTMDMNKGTPNEISLAERAKIDLNRTQLMDDLKANPLSNFTGAQSGLTGAAEGASEAVSDSFDPTWFQMLDLSRTSLINVGNEASGSQCSASKPVKTHANAVYLVQKAYSEIYIPVAILLLLPGAVITQTKGLVSFGILHSTNDEDTVSPFVGILRAIIAIFLIPCAQLIVSYSIDIGNSTQYEVSRHINYGNLFSYGDEQVFRAPLNSFPGSIVPPPAVLGKMSQGSEKAAKLLNQSPASIMLQMLANSMIQSAAIGLVILCAFQITMDCYLLLMGPIAAAFYAWPGSTGSLFTKVFANWVDAVINVSLWRFWWCVVLLCMDTRLGWLGSQLEIYSLWELLMFISFLVIMTYVPFNPFDFKPGDMVQQIMAKAEEAVQEASNKKGS